jgi:hypothetical protein
MFRDGYKNAQVVTSDGKKLGTVKSLDSKSLVVFKKGLIRDEPLRWLRKLEISAEILFCIFP